MVKIFTDDKLYNRRDVLEKLAIGERAFRQLQDHGLLPHTYIGRRRKYHGSMLNELVEKGVKNY